MRREWPLDCTSASGILVAAMWQQVIVASQNPKVDLNRVLQAYPTHSLPTHSNINDDNDWASDPRRHPRSLLMRWTSFSRVSTRNLRVWLLDFKHVNYGRRNRLTRRQFLLRLLISLICFILALIFFLYYRSDKRTLVFGRENLQQIWKWEIASGHHPTRLKGVYNFKCLCDNNWLIEMRVVPMQIGLNLNPLNPTLDPRKNKPARFRPPPSLADMETLGVGPERVYLDIPSPIANLVYPPRPIPGSIIDLDIIMEHCDYDQQKVHLTNQSLLITAYTFTSYYLVRS